VLWFITWLITRKSDTRPGAPVGIQNVGKDDHLPPLPPGR
jgi:hypothetical protein